MRRLRQENSLRTGVNEVQLVDAAGEWFVRVVENGVEAPYRTFDKKRQAVIYAEGERERLGIQKVHRV